MFTLQKNRRRKSHGKYIDSIKSISYLHSLPCFVLLKLVNYAYFTNCFLAIQLEIVQHEDERMEKQRQNSLVNDVWQLRKAPPPDWIAPMPDWWNEKVKDSYLQIVDQDPTIINQLAYLKDVVKGYFKRRDQTP